MEEQVTVEELFNKIQVMHESAFHQLNKDYDKLTDTEKAYDEGYLNGLDWVRRFMANTIVKG